MNSINFNDKKQRLQFQKLMEELNLHDEFTVEECEGSIGYNKDTKNLYAVLENPPNMKDDCSLCVFCDEDVFEEGGEVIWYMITNLNNGEETTYSYGELLRELIN